MEDVLDLNPWHYLKKALNLIKLSPAGWWRETLEMVKTLKVYWERGNGWFEPPTISSATETNGGTETADAATELYFNHIFVNSAYSEKHFNEIESFILYSYIHS